MANVAVCVLVVAVLVGLILLDRAGPPTARDIAWLAGTGTVPDDEAAVIRRYLGRHRRHRVVGGLVGVAAVSVGAVRAGGSADLVLMVFGGLCGVVVGTLSAETYRLGPRPGPTSVASLEPHDPAPLPGVVWTARGFLLASALGAAAIAAWGHGPGALLLVAVGAVVTAVAEATRGQIVGRRRPVLSLRARQLDGRIRTFAGRSVANLQLAIALLVAGGVLLAAPPADDVWGVVRIFGSLVAGVRAIVYAHRAAPRPPFFWRQPA